MADRKVLIIESDPKFNKVLPLFFRDSGFGVVVAQGGDDGVRLARSDSPAVILLNLEMENQKAYDVARTLKSDDATRKIPIIMMAEKKSEEDVQGDASLRGQWAGFIRKPFVKKSILQKVEDVL